MGVRIQFRLVSFGEPNYLTLNPGEPVFDPVTKRFGIGAGGFSAIWYPKATADGSLAFDDNTGLTSAQHDYSIKFTKNNIAWNINGAQVFATRDNLGVAVSGSITAMNEGGADVVRMGYGHYVALVTLLFNIKALLRKFVAGTATLTDVNAVFTAASTVNLPSLDPSFPELPSL